MLIFEQVECTIDNASNLRYLVLRELIKIIVECYMIEIPKKKFERGSHSIVC
jgi:hypothetical protein